ncbi:MAG: hypothetical protein ACRDRU_23445 [Pseudonocardiaceae bacterium]
MWGIRTLWISFTGLLVTAVCQLVVVLFSRLVALLGDTLHNVADTLTRRAGDHVPARAPGGDPPLQLSLDPPANFE